MRRASVTGTSTNDLRGFREGLHGCLVRRADALFELCDALLAASNASSPAHLSLEASYRRGWGSLYVALSKGGVDEGNLRDLLARRSCASGGSAPVHAVDVSPWPICDAEASPRRGCLYHRSRHAAGQPLVVGPVKPAAPEGGDTAPGP